MAKKCNYIEFRCNGIRKSKQCNALLFKYTLPQKGRFEVKCAKCGTYNAIMDGVRENTSRRILDEFSKNGHVKSK